MKVAIDADVCQGHGRCYEIAPDIFTDDDRGRGSVINPDVSGGLLESARAAVNACPERAISLSE